jgi:hypothetical protein
MYTQRIIHFKIISQIKYTQIKVIMKLTKFVIITVYTNFKKISNLFWPYTIKFNNTKNKNRITKLKKWMLFYLIKLTKTIKRLITVVLYEKMRNINISIASTLY